MSSVASQIFCTHCGTKHPSDALFCCKCGNHLVKPHDAAEESFCVEPEQLAPVSEVRKPTPPPSLQTSEPPPPPLPPPPSVASLALWNPLAAVLWSIVLTPAFGAYLHAKNWEALGEPARAKINGQWRTTLLMFFGIFAYYASEKTFELLQGICIVSIVIWFFMEAKPQIALVKARYSSGYTRKSWLAPLVVGFVLVFLYKCIFAYVFQQHELRH